MMLPRAIYFGPEQTDEFVQTIVSGHSKPHLLLLVSGSFLAQRRNSTVIKTLRRLLPCRLISCSGEPTVEDVDHVYDQFRTVPITGIVTIGGGSVIDFGKALSVAFSMGKTVSTILKDADRLSRSMFLYVVPTITGSGSEVTGISVLKEKNTKRALVHSCLVPDAVLLDPALLRQISRRQRLMNMLDTVSHAMESLLSVKNTFITEQYSLAALDIVLRNHGEYLKEERGGVEMIHRFQVASLFAGFAFGQSGVHLVHAFAYALVEQQPRMRHTRSVSLFLLPVLKYFLSKKKFIAKIEEYSQLLLEVIDLISTYRDDLYYENIPDIIGHSLIEGVVGNQRLLRNMPLVPVPGELAMVLEDFISYAKID